MQKEVETEFKKHLSKVCPDRRLGSFALEFLSDLSSHFEGQKFTKSDFETLVVDGKILEQDIVKDLFSKQEEATAEEVFLYLFKNGVKKLEFYKTNDAMPNACGYLDSVEQFLGIKKYDLSFFVYAPPKIADNAKVKPDNMTERQWKREEKKQEKEAYLDFIQTKKQAEQEFLESCKHTLYHELCHVFQVRTYENRKYIINNMSDRVLALEDRDSEVSVFFTHAQQIQKDLTENSNENFGYLSAAHDFIRETAENGIDALSEILNEELACKIQNCLNVEKFELPMCKHFVEKARLQANSGYTINYDIASLFHLAIGDVSEKDLRFNAAKVINKLNNLNISDEKFASIKQQFCNLFFDSVTNEEEKQMALDLAKEMETCDKYTALSTFIGSYDGVKHDSDYDEAASKSKLLVQNMLIESIKNDAIEKMNNKEVTKDKAFFENLNQTLQTLDNFCLYPFQTKGFFCKGETSVPQTIYESSVNLFSVAEFASTFPEHEHLAAFDQLVEAAKSCVAQHRDEVDGLDETMTFLQEQQHFDERYAQRLQEEEEALKIEEEARKKLQEKDTSDWDDFWDEDLPLPETASNKETQSKREI